eukprot:NODE_81_length_22753_cov_0.207072.p7 type:complete len:346 gc:universal NODE_81_length_22753_cov_0.207072:14556-13519(-)
MIVFLTQSYTTSDDCSNVINLASGLGMESAYPHEYQAIVNDCCSPYVTCKNNTITEIKWNSVRFGNLQGVLNGIALPKSLILLDLSNNKITGHIPDDLPSTLRFLNLYGNSFNGSIPSNLPQNLTQLQLTGNEMVGDVPELPKNLEVLTLGNQGIRGNQFSGTVVLNEPKELRINYNLITDVVIHNTSSLIVCDLSSNPLLGNPRIALLTDCVHSFLYSPLILPNTRTFLKSTTISKSAFRLSSKYVYSVTVSKARSSLSLYISEIAPSDDAPDTSSSSPLLVYLLFAGFAGLCVLVKIASMVFKIPTVKSRFSRKNSLGTLNTFTSVNTQSAMNSKYKRDTALI